MNLYLAFFHDFQSIIDSMETKSLGSLLINGLKVKVIKIQMNKDKLYLFCTTVPPKKAVKL